MMNRNTILCLIASMVYFPACVSAQALRIMSYNVRNALGMDKKTDYERVANVIKAANPDIVAVQELDSNTRRSGNKYVLQEVGSRCGYHYSYFPAIEFDGGKYGVGILSKEIPVKLTNVPLPGREENRTLGIAEFKKYVLFVVHLSLTEADRDASVNIIREQSKKITKPIFLAGDFNSEPGSNAINLFKKTGWKLLSGEAFTFPSNKPDICIDYIFARNGKYTVTATHVVNDSMASDHRPVVIDLTTK